jgi:nucleoside phosphorylase
VTLVVAAVPAELGDLPGEALGIGLVAAAASTARLIAERGPTRVLLVGTAGTFGEVPVGAVVQGRRLGLGSVAGTLGLGYQPGAPPVLHGVDLDLPGADVLTNLAITTDPSLATRFGAEWAVEHMETYGVAWACHAAGVAFGVVLGITNTVGPAAHEQWRANRGSAEAAARAAVAGVLARR